MLGNGGCACPKNTLRNKLIKHTPISEYVMNVSHKLQSTQPQIIFENKYSLDKIIRLIDLNYLKNEFRISFRWHILTISKIYGPSREHIWKTHDTGKADLVKGFSRFFFPIFTHFLIFTPPYSFLLFFLWFFCCLYVFLPVCHLFFSVQIFYEVIGLSVGRTERSQ